jgi:c-di-GMP-binding flagellar brake protein YcgR
VENGQEKRKFVRLSALVDVIYNKRTLTQNELSITRNISRGGICLIAYDELNEQDVLDLKLYLPEDKTPIRAIGKVVWVKEFIIGSIEEGKRFDVGIEFMDIKEEDANRVNKYVFSHIR